MGCLFCMSGEIRKRPDERELNIWATFVHKQNPNLFPTQLVQYKAWWSRQQALLSKTQAELDQLRQGLLHYESEDGSPPDDGDPRDLLQFPRNEPTQNGIHPSRDMGI